MMSEENLHQTQTQESLAKFSNTSSSIKLLRIFAAFAVCLCLLLGLGVFGLYLLFEGKTEKGSPMLSRIEQSVQEIIGPDYHVDIDAIDLSFKNLGYVSLVTNDLAVTRKADGVQVANAKRVETNLEFLKLISGETNFEYLNIIDAELDAGFLGSSTAYLLPSHLDKSLNELGNWFSRLEEKFSKGTFKGITISNAVIKGQVFGRKATDPLKITDLIVEGESAGSISLKAIVNTTLSDIDITSSYTDLENGWHSYDFNVSGIHAQEWLNSPEESEGFFANNGIINIKGEIPFDERNIAFEPKINLSSKTSGLRIGLKNKTQIQSVDLNFRLLLERNQIELDPSYMEIGRLKAELIGGIKPVHDTKGYAGPILYDLIMKKGLFEPTLENEPIIPVGVKAAGVYDGDARRLTFDDLIFTTERGHVSGHAVVDFNGETPAVKGEGATDGISLTAIKQFWPYFIANGARDWVHSHVSNGWIEQGSITADIPPGILFRLKKGKKFTPEQFSIKTKMQKVVFRAFGDMPNITEGEGEVNLEGMKISAKLSSGFVEGFDKKKVQIQSGSFETLNFADPNRIAKTSITLDGDAKSIAKISNREPLRVMERMKVVPEQFSGKMHADVVADFPIGKKLSSNDIKWNILMDLEGGKSTRKLAGRKFSNANILIDANPTSAKVSGTALIDGVKARLNLVEPIGKSGKVRRKRIIKSTLTEKDRKKLGINLSPVVLGDVDVEIADDGKSQFLKVDLSKSKIEFPWVGWSKGRGIPAKSSFRLSQKNGTYTLDKLKFSGGNFGAAGRLVFNKKGLLSADIEKLVLNDKDDLSLKVKLEGNVYNINAAGLSFDARGIINALIYDGDFEEAQGGRSVNLVANFAKVKGFSGREIQNVLMLYESANGRLQKLDLRGADRNNEKHRVEAARSKGNTYFNINSQNAGAAFAFTNIYTRMRGGRLDAKLVQADKGPYIGPVRVQNFTLVNEPRLEGIVSSKGAQQIINERGERPLKINDNGEKTVRFQLAQSQIEKGKGYMNLQDAIIRSPQIGMSMNGVLYNGNDRMNLTGTYMPANVVNLALSNIPIFSQLFSNGRDNAFIGITYQLKGKRENPELLINPLSVVAPGIFKKVFEFRN